VEILNQGAADATGEILMSVDDGPPISAQVRPGEPLRAGQRVQGPVPGYYLQLRRNLTVTIVPANDRPEEDLANNTWVGIIGPDAPNDVEILGAVPGAEGEPLVVTVRNNSPIPVAGSFTLSVREALPGTQLLGRERVTAEVASSGTFDVVFDELTEVDMTRATVILSTDAIDDADVSNNVYPR